MDTPLIKQPRFFGVCTAGVLILSFLARSALHAWMPFVSSQSYPRYGQMRGQWSGNMMGGGMRRRLLSGDIRYPLSGNHSGGMMTGQLPPVASSTSGDKIPQ